MTIKVTCLRQILRDVRQLPAERRDGVLEIFRATVRVAMRDDFPGPGEGLRLYRPKVDQAARAACRQRIVAALDAGEAVYSIARRERVSERWVRKLRAQASTLPAGTPRP